MNQFEAAEKYGLTLDQVHSIDCWFIQSPIPLEEFDIRKSVPFMSRKLNLTQEDTLNLLQGRLNSVMRTKRLNNFIKWGIFFFIGFCLAYFLR